MGNQEKNLIEVKAQRVIQAKKWKILRLIMRVQDFPQFIPNVKQCSVFEKGAGYAITCWKVEFNKLPLSWKERDEFDLKKFSIRFKAVEGDFEHFEGEWLLRDLPSGGVEVTFRVDIILGIPLVEKVMGKVLAEKIKESVEYMLSAINEKLSLKRYKNIRHRKISDLQGFAVIGHPYNLQHLIRYFKYFKPDFKPPSQEFLVKLFELTPSYRSYDIKHFKSKTGKEAHGFFIMCPIIPDMLSWGPEKVVQKVIEACKVAEDLGVGIVTLGGFTSIAGEQYGKSLTSFVNVPVTTGNAFTVALTLEGIRKAAQLMEIDMSKAKFTVIGGTGDIGGACVRVLSGEVAEVTITSRSEKNLMEVERFLAYYGRAKIKTSRDNNEAVRGADIVLAAASASASIIDFKSFKPGAVICDVGYPKNISYTSCDRDDILIFSGGIASIPSEFDLGFDIGLPNSRVLYGCFAEAIVLDLEERYENFSLGKGNINLDKVQLIRQMAEKHGFGLAPFFWGNRLLETEEIEAIKENAKAAILRNGF